MDHYVLCITVADSFWFVNSMLNRVRCYRYRRLSWWLNKEGVHTCKNYLSVLYIVLEGSTPTQKSACLETPQQMQTSSQLYEKEDFSSPPLAVNQFTWELQQLFGPKLLNCLLPVGCCNVTFQSFMFSGQLFLYTWVSDTNSGGDNLLSFPTYCTHTKLWLPDYWLLCSVSSHLVTVHSPSTWFVLVHGVFIKPGP